jgi:WD40 repeat protein
MHPDKTALQKRLRLEPTWHCSALNNFADVEIQIETVSSTQLRSLLVTQLSKRQTAYVACLRTNNSIFVWDYLSEELIFHEKSYNRHRSLLFLNENQIACFGDRFVIYNFRTKEKITLESIHLPKYIIRAIQLRPNIIIGITPEDINVWDVNTTKIIAQHPFRTDFIERIDETQFATIHDSFITIWNEQLEQIKQISFLKYGTFARRQQISCLNRNELLVSFNGIILVCNHKNKTIKLLVPHENDCTIAKVNDTVFATKSYGVIKIRCMNTGNTEKCIVDKLGHTDICTTANGVFCIDENNNLVFNKLGTDQKKIYHSNTTDVQGIAFYSCSAVL